MAAAQAENRISHSHSDATAAITAATVAATAAVAAIAAAATSFAATACSFQHTLPSRGNVGTSFPEFEA